MKTRTRLGTTCAIPADAAHDAWKKLLVYSPGGGTARPVPPRAALRARRTPRPCLCNMAGQRHSAAESRAAPAPSTACLRGPGVRFSEPAVTAASREAEKVFPPPPTAAQRKVTAGPARPSASRLPAPAPARR